MCCVQERWQLVAVEFGAAAALADAVLQISKTIEAEQI
jgi:hypothetical protein